MTGENDLNDGQAERDKGMTRAYRAANPEWKAFCYECIVSVARRQLYFTTDDIEALRVSRGGPNTHENRALGPLIMQAKRAGICHPTQHFENSRRRLEHARPLRVWESMLFQNVQHDDYGIIRSLMKGMIGLCSPSNE